MDHHHLHHHRPPHRHDDNCRGGGGGGGGGALARRGAAEEEWVTKKKVVIMMIKLVMRIRRFMLMVEKDGDHKYDIFSMVEMTNLYFPRWRSQRQRMLRGKSIASWFSRTAEL